MKKKDSNHIEKALKALSLYDVIQLFAMTIKPPLISANHPNSKQENKIAEEEFLTGHQVDELLEISSVTRHRYANQGLLTRHKISRRKILYRQDEVLQLLQARQAGML